MKLKIITLIIISFILTVSCLLEEQDVSLKLNIEWNNLEETKRYIPVYTNAIIIEIYEENSIYPIFEEKIEKNENTPETIEIEELDVGKYRINVYSKGLNDEILAKAELEDVEIKKGYNYLEVELNCIIPIEEISLNTKFIEYRIGDSFFLDPIIYPENSSETNISYNCSDEEILSIDTEGEITAVGIGEAEILILAENKVFNTIKVLIKEKAILLTSVEILEGDQSINIGDQVSLTVTLLPGNATDKSLSWLSTNSNIATVSSTGVLTGVSEGTVSIKATSVNEIEDVITVTVVDPNKLLGLEITNEISSMYVGVSLILTTDLSPIDVTAKVITWTSSDSSVISVDSTGRIIGVKEGSATISASCEGIIDSVTIEVKIIDVTGVEINVEDMEIDIDETVLLSATLLPENATDKNLTWLSINSNVATVSVSGLLTGVSEGTVGIKATSTNGIEDEITITVVDPNKLLGLEITNKIESMYVEDSLILTTTLSPSDVTGKVMTWVSSDSSIISVDDTGRIIGLKEGTATITVSSEGIIDSITIEVTIEIIDETVVEINAEDIEIDIDETVSLTATVLPEDATDKTVTWLSTNPEVATVSNTGLLIGISEGTVSIKATSVNGIEDVITVTVVDSNKLLGLEITNQVSSIYIGNSLTLTTALSPADVTDKVITWTSSDSSVISVDNTGRIIGLKEGTATISASCEGIIESITIIVRVEVIYVTGVEINNANMEIDIDETVSLTATVLPGNATNKSLTWSSTNSNIATVSASGLLTGVSEGTVSIKATSVNGIEDVITVTVVAPNELIGLEIISQVEMMYVGESLTLAIALSPPDVTGKVITWSSSDSSVISVDSTGRITGLQEGAATISASCEGITANLRITVLFGELVP